MAANGHPVAIIDLNDEGLAEVSGLYPAVTAFSCHVTDHHASKNVVSDVEQSTGEIDRLIVCAAIMPGGEQAETDPAKILRFMQINYGDIVIYGSTAGIVPIDASAHMAQRRQR
jgi:NADP-dependent 3-hydroxy acid dehydrogenase YdfG